MKQVVISERALRILVWTLIGALILGAGLGVTKKLIDTAPEAPKVAPEQSVPRVFVEHVVISNERVTVAAQGEVSATSRTQVAAEVPGKVIEVSPKFKSGEVFEEGELMLRIDPADYQAARANALATLESAKMDLELELANGERARRDWQKLGKGEPSDLVLRKPQLASRKALVASAEAAFDKALRDVERTEVRALYACRLERTHVDLGATVAAGTPLVDVMSLGPVEVRLPLSLEDYGYVELSPKGEISGEVVASAKLGGEEREWKGSLIRSEGFVEATTRSVNVIAQFGGGDQQAPPVGLFVDAEVTGRSLQGVVKLPRIALVEPGKVLIVTDENEVDFREVEVIRTSETDVLIGGGLEEGERVCITTLNAPVKGMEVTVVGEEDEEKEESKEGEV